MMMQKAKKVKKHKKHHRHEDGAGEAMGGGAGSAAGGSGLKLKIKFGSGDPDAAGGSSGSHKKKKKKKEKKKEKEKHKHHHKEKRKREMMAEGVTEEGGVPEPPKVPKMDPVEDLEKAEEAMEVDSPPAEVDESERMKSSAIKSKPLYRLLDHLLPQLQKRDTQHFFALPVQDKFAPGYSQIIKEPMDFSTIRTKLDSGEYAELDLFRDDFKLMCTNAMTYNTQETIYYKTAKKLMLIGMKLLTPEKLILMREQLHFMNDLTEDELGFDINEDPSLRDGAEDEDDEDDDDGDVSRVIEDIREIVRRPPGRFEAPTH